MGQREVITFLNKRRGKRYTSIEIARGLDCPIGAVDTAVRQLIRYKLLKWGYRTEVVGKDKNKHTRTVLKVWK